MGLKDLLINRWHLTSESIYNEAMARARRNYLLWQSELEYRKHLLGIFEQTLKDACATGGDLCKYCQSDWKTCGHSFSCHCEHFILDKHWEDHK